MRCRAAEDQLLPMLLGMLAPRERANMERHLTVCARCAGALRALELAGSAYDEAFATLRSRRARLAAGRARLAAATEPPVGLSVVTLAVVGSLGVEPTRPTAASPQPALLAGPAVGAPELVDSDLIRAARLKYIQTRDMVIRVPAGSAY